jgi:NAD(P)-dependent dehydrogenase (short-subunit alcohol dehydrogenase family)
MSKVYFITGAGRGLGPNLVREALAAGHQVVGAARWPAAVSAAVGPHEQLLASHSTLRIPRNARQPSRGR